MNYTHVDDYDFYYSQLYENYEDPIDDHDTDILLEAKYPGYVDEGQVYWAIVPYNNINPDPKHDKHYKEYGGYKCGRRGIVLRYPDGDLRFAYVTSNVQNEKRDLAYNIKPPYKGFSKPVTIRIHSSVPISELDLPASSYKGYIDPKELTALKKLMKDLYKLANSNIQITLDMLKYLVTKDQKETDRVQSMDDIIRTRSASYIDIANVFHVAAMNKRIEHVIFYIQFIAGDELYRRVTVLYKRINEKVEWIACRAIPGRRTRGELWRHGTSDLNKAIELEKEYIISEYNKDRIVYDVETMVFSGKMLDTWDTEVKKSINGSDLINIMCAKHKPLYFYHIVNKGSDMTYGLISPRHMYDTMQYELLDKHLDKYRERISGGWGLSEKKPDELSREEIMSALNKFRRDPDGTNMIYFFRYPPSAKLGPNMAKVLERKDIYRININDPDVKKRIKKIFWGFDMSHSDNKTLTREYYENVTEREYFKRYDDNGTLLFATLNHIGISPVGGNIPLKLLEKVS